jgi:BirA family biotin operon repressor/biotin-[acetyl-CoA-carboxylase] ligase
MKRKIYYFEKISSTNLKAKELFKEKKIDFNSVILAESQTAGYGKEKRFWFSPKGGLYFSVILKPKKIKDLQILMMISAICLAKVLKEKFNLKAEIKWPNDVLINNKKVAGILIENILGKNPKAQILGIGLNTNIKNFPENLKEKATSLEIELKRKVNNREILNSILSTLEKYF